MVSTNAKKYKTISLTCYTANIAYLILHVFYLTLFIVVKLPILIYINAAIIAIYCGFFFLIKAKKYYLYALCCGNLFFAFIAATTIMIGFNTGFTFYLIGLCVISFFTTYFSKNRGIIGSIVWVILSLILFLTLYFITQFNAPTYLIPQWLEITLFVTHSIIVFAFIAGYLVVFLKYAFGLEKKIMNESRTDELTEINNRYALYDYIDAQDNKSGLVLAIFDIDDFKVINDTYGHVTGDYILKEVAKISTKELDGSFVCRYGGEEFVIVIRESDQKKALNVFEGLRKTFEDKTFEYNNIQIKITITLGASYYTEGIALDKWVTKADEKMYFGKNSGKNIVVI